MTIDWQNTETSQADSRAAIGTTKAAGFHDRHGVDWIAVNRLIDPSPTLAAQEWGTRCNRLINQRVKEVSLESALPGYRVTRQLGTGARSKVFLATELATGKKVAVKRVVRETADDDRFIEQAETEHTVCSKILHPFLRQSYRIHRVRKLLVTREVMSVMEYVDGLTLEQARPNRLHTFLTIYTRVAEGLLALHRGGYIHSDIKPTNIMLAEGGVLKIIDFGQACPLGHKKSRIQGTPDYIAPEQVRRLPLDARTDVYNLGATMYWLLTSENYPTAIQGADPRGGIRIVSGDKPLAPIEWNDKIPLSLSKLVMECCSENPSERPSDMQQVIARLAVVRKLWNKQRDGLRTKRLESPSAQGGEETQSEVAE